MKWQTLALLTVMGGWVTPAMAQSSGTLDRFRPSEIAADGFAIRRAAGFSHLVPHVSFSLDYANDPLVYNTALGSDAGETTRVVAHQLTGHVGGGLGLFDRALVYAGLPLNLVMAGDADAQSLGLAPAQSTALSDPYFGARVRLVGDESGPVALAMATTVYAPLAEAAHEGQRYSGSDGWSARPEIIAEVRTDAFWSALNLGVAIGSSTVIDNLEVGSELSYGLGLGAPLIGGTLSLHAEWYGSTSLSDVGGREVSPMELLAGLKYHALGGLTVSVAGGPGLGHGYGAPDARVVTGLSWTPRLAIVDGWYPVDLDGDGLLDDEERCPNEPEDFDGVADGDGCPESDHDGDGVPDADDACPIAAEDFDLFADDDGCPEVDNDQDGISDDYDLCPIDAGPPGSDGCPE